VGLSRAAESRAEFERAALLTRNARERQVLLDRAKACDDLANPQPVLTESDTRRLQRTTPGVSVTTT
jgi:hypothetical protein